MQISNIIKLIKSNEAKFEGVQEIIIDGIPQIQRFEIKRKFGGYHSEGKLDSFEQTERKEDVREGQEEKC